MRIYKISYNTPDHGTVLLWAGNAAAAKADARQIKKDEATNGNDCDPTVWPMDIPINKAGLLAWLNIHFTTDNG